MRSPSLWDDLNNPFEIVFRLGGRLLGLVICCAFAYQAYDALRSATLGVNPNGSLNDIAGVANDRGNVVGLMPHPEHATEPGFGPDTDAAMRSGVDGLTVFTSAIAALTAV